MHILHQYVRHDTGLRLGEDVDDAALEVNILLHCRVGSNAGFLGDTRISQNLKVLYQPGRPWASPSPADT